MAFRAWERGRLARIRREAAEQRLDKLVNSVYCRKSPF